MWVRVLQYTFVYGFTRVNDPTIYVEEILEHAAMGASGPMKPSFQIDWDVFLKRSLGCLMGPVLFGGGCNCMSRLRFRLSIIPRPSIRQFAVPILDIETAFAV